MTPVFCGIVGVNEDVVKVYDYGVHIQYRLCTNVSSISHFAMLQNSIQEEENILPRPLSKISASDHNRNPDSCS